MKPDEQHIRSVLEMLAGGATCDYAPIQGDVVIILSEAKKLEGVDISTFLALREQGLISKQRTTYHWHPFFRPSFQNPINAYGITDKGRAYLRRQG